METLTTLIYKEEVAKAMELLARDNRTIFIGQTVAYSGSRFTQGTLTKVPITKKIELPVMEEVQMGISTGLALEGYIPISIYPRFDFLILATNQLVNHLDKMEELSGGQFKPKVIIRAIVGARNPYPGPQHCKDYTEPLKQMLTNIDVVKLSESKDIVPSYLLALESKRSTLLIELGDLHL